MGVDLPLIWAAVILMAVTMYVIMDGFDLGVGILFPFIKNETDRDMMISTVTPVWDGNETWLVLGGAALYAAFPLAYAVILEALALPLTFMLLGLIFRGVAFEFHFNVAPKYKYIWNRAFIGGSILTTFCQGIIIGSFINGFEVVDRHFVGGAFDWFSFFPLFCGVGLVAAYALLGSTWLILKTEGNLQVKMREITRYLVLFFLIIIAIISFITPIIHTQIAERWFYIPNLFFFLPVPILVLLSSYGIWHKTYKADSHAAPFLLALLLVFLGLSGFVISIWPYVIPSSITIWQAASPPQTQGFVLLGTLFVLPFVFMYTAWTYYVFRGKAKPTDGYH